VGAAAVYAVFVPRPRVHKGLDEQAEGGGAELGCGVRGFELRGSGTALHARLQLVQQFAEGFAFAAAAGEVFGGVADFVAEEILHLAEVHEVADGAGLPADFQKVADGRAVRIAAGERGEVVEAEAGGGLGDEGEDDVGGVEMR